MAADLMPFFFLSQDHTSYGSSIRCQSSLQSPSVEAFLDYAIVSNNLHFTHKPQDSNWTGSK